MLGGRGASAGRIRAWPPRAGSSEFPLNLARDPFSPDRVVLQVAVLVVPELLLGWVDLLRGGTAADAGGEAGPAVEPGVLDAGDPPTREGPLLVGVGSTQLRPPPGAGAIFPMLTGHSSPGSLAPQCAETAGGLVSIVWSRGPKKKKPRPLCKSDRGTVAGGSAEGSHTQVTAVNSSFSSRCSR